MPETYGEMLREYRPSQTLSSTASLLSLAGKTAMVAGGAGPGLGAAISRRLAAQGADVVIVDIDHARGTALATEITDTYQVSTGMVEADLTSVPGVEAAVRQVAEQHGPIDISVNSLGGGGVGEFLRQSFGDDERIVLLNLLSPLYLVRAVTRHMIAEKRPGTIVNISSTSAELSWVSAATYNACKAGVSALTKSLARELAAHSIRINAIAPGTISSERLVSVFESPGESNYPQVLRDALDRTALHRPGAPDEFAVVVAFLASDASSYVQGAVWPVSGGMA